MGASRISHARDTYQRKLRAAARRFADPRKQKEFEAEKEKLQTELWSVVSVHASARAHEFVCVRVACWTKAGAQLVHTATTEYRNSAAVIFLSSSPTPRKFG